MRERSAAGLNSVGSDKCLGGAEDVTIYILYVYRDCVISRRLGYLTGTVSSDQHHDDMTALTGPVPATGGEPRADRRFCAVVHAGVGDCCGSHA